MQLLVHIRHYWDFVDVDELQLFQHELQPDPFAFLLAVGVAHVCCELSELVVLVDIHAFIQLAVFLETCPVQILQHLLNAFFPCCCALAVFFLNFERYLQIFQPEIHRFLIIWLFLLKTTVQILLFVCIAELFLRACKYLDLPPVLIFIFFILLLIFFCLFLFFCLLLLLFVVFIFRFFTLFCYFGLFYWFPF